MSTKDISRSAVEPGRSHGYGYIGNRLLQKAERRAPVGEDELDPSGKRGYPERRDKLSPLYRWLQKHVGLDWDSTYSEFCSKFDRRSLKGWHLHLHLEDLVEVGGFRERFNKSFSVDNDGILRKVRFAFE